MERVASLNATPSSLATTPRPFSTHAKAHKPLLGSLKALSAGVTLGTHLQKISRNERRQQHLGRVVVQVAGKQAAVAPPSVEGDHLEKEEEYDCVVVGAGISGLCTAQALNTR